NGAKVSRIRTCADGETNLSFEPKVRALRILPAGFWRLLNRACLRPKVPRRNKSEALTQDLIQKGVLLTAVNTEPRGSHRKAKTSSSFCPPSAPFLPTAA